ncbi:hypothetical protein ACFE04_031144 [Oxalis oulophora]
MVEYEFDWDCQTSFFNVWLKKTKYLLMVLVGWLIVFSPWKHGFQRSFVLRSSLRFTLEMLLKKRFDCGIFVVKVFDNVQISSSIQVKVDESSFTLNIYLEDYNVVSWAELVFDDISLNPDSHSLAPSIPISHQLIYSPINFQINLPNIPHVLSQPLHFQFSNLSGDTNIIAINDEIQMIESVGVYSGISSSSFNNDSCNSNAPVILESFKKNYILVRRSLRNSTKDEVSMGLRAGLF